jgi:glyoxylase-like metal-dependent hydrolase (beta-lactamase superfamily II)
MLQTRIREVSMSDVYEVFAIRYGHKAERTRRESFLGIDPHDASPMPIDYFIWLIRNEARTFVLDLGFDHIEAEARGRRIERLPREGLAMLGVEAAKVKEVIVSHLHYDHAGCFGDFPAATFHLQEAEMAYATGRCMSYAHLQQPYTCEHVVSAVRHVFAGRVAFTDGDREIAPGISLHLIGGHAKGIQAMRVNTARGPVVLASDSAHYYENFEQYKPFIIAHDVEATLRGYDRLRDLAPSINHIVPGHDPLVMQRYPAVNEALAGVAVRLDVDPVV